MPETSYWEIAPVALSLAQMIFYILALISYEEKLIEIAEKMDTYAENDKAKYLAFRAKDPAFYAYYMSLPDYEPCGDDIAKSKGFGFHSYGTRLRTYEKSRKRGFAPLAMIVANASEGINGVRVAATERAAKHVNEESIKNLHTLERWNAIVSAPTGNEGNYISAGYAPIISSISNDFKAAGRGFNSAGTAFGSSLFHLLNS